MDELIELLDHPAMEQQPIPPEHTDRLVAFFDKLMELWCLHQGGQSDEEHVTEAES